MILIVVPPVFVQKSWVDKMLECVRNREKQAKKKAWDSSFSSPPVKRQQLNTTKDYLLRRYRARIIDNDLDDSLSLDYHNKAISEEMKKPKPRDSVLLPLYKSTFRQRRMFVQTEAHSASNIIQKLSCISRPALVSCQKLYCYYYRT